MTRWAGFVGLTVLLISVLLVLTRATQRMVKSDPRFQEPTAATEPFTRQAASRTLDPTHHRDAVEPASDPDATATDSPADPAAERPSLSTGTLVANVVTQGAVAIVVLAGVWYFGVPLGALGIPGHAATSGLHAIATGLGLGVVLWVGSETLTTLSEAVGFGADESLRGLLAPETTGGWIALLGIALPIVAISEELLFRAAAIGAPVAGFETSPWALAIVSSVAFGFCHGIQGRAGVLVTGLLGLALASAYIHTGSLLVVIVAHYVLNATEFLVHERNDIPMTERM